MKKQTANGETAAVVASELLTEIINVEEVFHNLRERLDVPHYQRLLTAVRPEYASLEKFGEDTYKKLEAIVGEEHKKLLMDHDDNGVDIIAARELANFHLGYATALRMVGMAYPAALPTNSPTGRKL